MDAQVEASQGVRNGNCARDDLGVSFAQIGAQRGPIIGAFKFCKVDRRRLLRVRRVQQQPQRVQLSPLVPTPLPYHASSYNSTNNEIMPTEIEHLTLPIE